ncbi:MULTISPECIES: SgcJ/EcaC family oxidoreductase [Streptomyces]|uniref:SgcJ/EcaC family oxidoreductase n=1 Tax=Streptomyces TaxID=1883 RepID=UPI0005B94F95|nr:MULTISPECIES: SgcJ/EcaC family oxidoreductase [Streptomyces]GHE24558.1 hypothetical protein GCM10018784_72210 [Streptomyces hydrogenans]
MKRMSRTRAVLAGGLAVATLGTVAAGVGVARGGEEDSRRAGPGEREIAALFDRWNAALRSGDAERVTDLYAEDAVLLPTASPRIRTDHAAIADYFTHFLRKKPWGEKLRTEIEVLDADSAIDAGVYRFHLTDPATGVTKPVDARYTYVYEKRGGTWLIVNHHSSVLPAEG